MVSNFSRLAMLGFHEIQNWSELKKISESLLPKLQELPSLPPKLRKLEIDNIGWKTFNLLQGTSNCYIISSLAAIRDLTIRNCGDLIYLKGLKDLGTTENSQLILNELIIKDPSVLLMEPLSSITSIQKLTIKVNDELVSFPVETEQWFLQVSSYLRELNFISLKSLQYLPSSLASLSSLKILCVREVPHLQLLQNIPAFLEHLELSHIESLKCLPSSLSNSSIKIPQLKELPDLPPSLKSLSILYCHPDLKERYRKFVGSDWHKIAHIPYVNLPTE
ncbi:hypothetical protein KFK09_010238 [Dendrobium nobile]|uniref:Disease resistance protein n=1 Tax=Dendrobium nobile TaxID=94219 RepID=A0A8T3BNS9_DENNO|nr:hypothetical protein KFK09_010238 [Dendrobium nobile]